jgi:hypothetical protein
MLDLPSPRICPCLLTNLLRFAILISLVERRENMSLEAAREAVERKPLDETGPQVIKTQEYISGEDALHFVQENFKDPALRYIMLDMFFPRR